MEAQDETVSPEACEAIQDTRPEAALDMADELMDAHAGGYIHLMALSCRAWALGELERPDAAHTAVGRLVAGIDDLADPVRRGELWRKAGAVMHRLDDRLAATEYYARALTAIDMSGEVAGQIPVLINLGVLYSQMEQHDRAITHYNDALALMTETGEDRNRIPVLFNLGMTHNGNGQYARAADYLGTALESLSDDAPPVYRARILDGLATVEINRGNLENAATHIERARELLEQAGGNPFIELNLDLTAINLDLEQGNPEQAIDAARTAREAARAADFGSQARSAQSLLARALAASGRWQAALEAYRTWFAEREQYLIETNREQIAAIETHLADRRQAEELERLRNEQALERMARTQRVTRQRWLWLGMAVVLAGILGVVAWQRRINRRLAHLSRTDQLTGLPNRRDMGERVARADRSATRTEPSTRTVFLVDLDDFKAINDRYGHETGDAVLREIAARIAGITRDEDWVARWGGEEFLIIAGGLDAERAGTFCERLIDAISTEPIHVQTDPHVRVTASTGFAPWQAGQEAGPDFESACRLADAALYGAKSAGRNTWRGIWPDEQWDPAQLDSIARDPDRAERAGRVRVVRPG